MKLAKNVFIIMLCFIVIGCNTDSAKNYLQREDYSILLKEKIYDGFNRGPIQEDYEYNITSDWISTITNHPYYALNQPHLAWKVSWILEGMIYAYKATGDDIFLKKSLFMYEELLKRRDVNENRTAWDGKLYPLWGSTSRYNGATFQLIDKNDNKIGSIDFYGGNHDQTMVAIRHKSSQGNCFDLIIKHVGELKEIKNVTLSSLEKRVHDEIEWSYYGSPLKNNKVVKASINCKDLNAMPVECELTLVDNINVPTVIHSALILEPMVDTYIELNKLKHPLTNKYKTLIEEMFDTLLDLAWQLQGNNGYFREPLNSPTFLGGGKILPWNQQIVLVAAIAKYAKEENNEYYMQIVTKWSNNFLEHIEKTDRGYLWKYWEEPTGTITWYESTNYGGIDVDSIYAIYNTGIAFSDEDMNEIAKTISLRIIGEDGTVSPRIDGKTKRGDIANQLFRYLPYTKRIPKIIDILKKQDMNWAEASKMLYYYNQYEIK